VQVLKTSWTQRKAAHLRGAYYAQNGFNGLFDGYYCCRKARRADLPKKAVSSNNVVGPFGTAEQAAVARSEP
jgi:hypothetical protein